MKNMYVKKNYKILYIIIIFVRRLFNLFYNISIFYVIFTNLCIYYILTLLLYLLFIMYYN